jgi:hypothetical protein
VKKLNPLRIIGTILILLALCLNKYVIGYLFSPTGKVESLKFNIVIILIELILFSIGVVCIRFPKIILKRKEFITNTLTIIITIMIMLYGINFLLVKMYDMPKNGLVMGKLYTWGNEINLNQYGFREDDFEVPKPDNTLRIMHLGDSLTYGTGLSDEEMYGNILEDKLNELDNCSKKIEVLNFAASGKVASQHHEFLEKYKDIVEPDLIITSFSLNLQPKGQDYTPEKETYQTIYKKIAYYGALFGLDMLSRTSLRVINLYFESKGTYPNVIGAIERTFDNQSKEWQLYLESLEKIKSSTQEMNISKPVFFTQNQGTSTLEPTDYNNPDEILSKYLVWYELAENAAEEKGFQVVNIVYELKSANITEPLSVNKMDGHPSAKVNELYAEKLFITLKDQIIEMCN